MPIKGQEIDAVFDASFAFLLFETDSSLVWVSFQLVGLNSAVEVICLVWFWFISPKEVSKSLRICETVVTVGRHVWFPKCRLFLVEHVRFSAAICWALLWFEQSVRLIHLKDWVRLESLAAKALPSTFLVAFAFSVRFLFGCLRGQIELRANLFRKIFLVYVVVSLV